MTKHDKPSDHAEHTGHSRDDAKAKDASHDGHKHDHKQDHAECDCCAAPIYSALIQST